MQLREFTLSTQRNGPSSQRVGRSKRAAAAKSSCSWSECLAWKLRDAEPIVRIPTSSFIGSNSSFVSLPTAWKGSPRHIGYVIIGEIPR